MISPPAEPAPRAALGGFLASGKVILHLGAHKTATTHIQATMRDQRDMLADQGTAVILPSDLRGRHGLHRLGGKHPDEQARLERENRTKLLDALELCASTPGLRQITLSEEGILGSPRECLTAGHILPFLEPNLRSLPTELDHPNVTVIFAVRDYGSFFSSCFTTTLRRGKLFDAEHLKPLLRTLPNRWEHVLHDIRAALPRARLKIWRHEDFAKVAPQVFDMLAPGMPLPPDGASKFQNLSRDAVAHILRRNAPGASLKEPRKRIRRARRRYPVTQDNPPFSLWNAEDAASLTAAYEESWAALVHAYPDAVL
ncbi:hypothetical protein E4Z66_18670 [Aliishimia ponticola]|uniref:Sulfotransferase family protein n=1 Tax=Aliishimia ponticola TaxID=2499833 RepID=A0A4S4N5S6_9RHOB|nr:hypothetical protein [Aliishimia ponticola]THH34454.1 hypothetical protein E4Z66_18670 [Aliishimia ponticola]